MRNRAEAREFREREEPKRPELNARDQAVYDKLLAECDRIRERGTTPEWHDRVVAALKKYEADDYLTGTKWTKFYKLLAAEHGRRGREQQKAGRPAKAHPGSSFTDEQIRGMVADAQRREIAEKIRSGEIEPPDDRPTRPLRPHPDHP